MRIGAHVSVSAGPAASAAYAAEVGCECVQVFAKSPRQWRGPRTDPRAAGDYAEAFRAARAWPLFTHTSYLLNLAGDDEVLWEKSVEALGDELCRARLLHAEGVVTHLGTFAHGDVERAAERIAHAAERAVLACGGESLPPLLLENGAGAGTTFGARMSELAAALAAIRPRGIAAGICLDTCHAHAAGVDVSGEGAWTALMDELDATCGPGVLGLVHANDCAFEFGARRDRHAWIGDGTIGPDGFAAMLCEPRLAGVCAVTEMSGEKPEKDQVNLARLRSLRVSCGEGAPDA